MALTGKDVLRLVVDADTSGAVREFDKLGKTANKELGGIEKKTKGFSGAVTSGLDKLTAKSPMAASALQKVGLSTSQLGAMAGPALISGLAAGGAAIGVFAAKSINQFQDTALAAGKFADATGLSVESASKYIAVADDIGVGAGTIQNAFVKMEKAIDTNRDAFGDLVVTAKDGSTDLDATFLNVIRRLQGIKDPIQRANEASKFFGRGFAEVAEIIGTDADELKAALEGVSDAQIVDDEELGKARQYRAAMDTLGDAVMELQMEFGEALVPAISSAAEQLAGFVDIANSVTGPLGGIGNTIDKFVQNAPIFGSGIQFGKIFEDGASGVDRFGAAVGTVIPVVGNLIAGLDGVKVKATAAALGIAEIVGIPLPEKLEAGRVSAGGWGQAMQAAAIATQAHGMAVRADRADLEEFNSALQESINLQLAAIDATFAVNDSYRQFQSAVDAANTTVDDGTTTMNEQQAAIDAAAQAALANAVAIAEMDRQQQEAAGGSQSAKEKTDILIGSLMKLASESSPAVAQAIGGLITKLQTYDTTEANPELTATDNATPKINAVKLNLADLDGRNATVTVNALTGGAINSLNNVFDAFNRLPDNFNFPVRREGGPIPGSPGQPVPVLAHGGEYVLSADVVDRIKKGEKSIGADASSALSLAGRTGSGAVTIVNFTGTFLASKAELGRMVDEAIAESRRRGNRAA